MSREIKVYPRWCGGRGLDHVPHVVGEGLSPLVRGTGRGRSTESPRLRSIPAGAGDGAGRRRVEQRRGVYPRWCGGRGGVAVERGLERGLSPLVRGTGTAKAATCRTRGSIPAGAGDGCATATPARGCWVYPRWCGGRPARATHNGVVRGLSPLVRGTATRRHRQRSFSGSIPAGAGDGYTRERRPCGTWVYPRWCGGRHPRAEPRW